MVSRPLEASFTNFANSFNAWPRSPAFPNAETAVHCFFHFEIAGVAKVDAAAAVPIAATPVAVFFIKSRLFI